VVLAKDKRNRVVHFEDEQKAAKVKALTKECKEAIVAFQKKCFALRIKAEEGRDRGLAWELYMIMTLSRQTGPKQLMVFGYGGF